MVDPEGDRDMNGSKKELEFEHKPETEHGLPHRSKQTEQQTQKVLHMRLNGNYPCVHANQTEQLSIHIKKMERIGRGERRREYTRSFVRIRSRKARPRTNDRQRMILGRGTNRLNA